MRNALWGMIVVLAVLGTAVGTAEAQVHNNIGVGVGIPFGVIGMNYELEWNLAPWFAIGPTVGLGYAGDFAWNVGLQTHFLKEDGLFRPGISVWYGTNAIEVGSTGDSDYFDDADSREGLSVGVSGRFQFGQARQHCIDLYVLWCDVDIDEDHEERLDSSDWKVGLGYVYRF